MPSESSGSLHTHSHPSVFMPTETKYKGSRLLPQDIDVCTVNLENFKKILFMRIALKDLFATLEIHDWCMIKPY